ncbi:hypothetical protein PsAD26_04116 [Pseudovibrio sp. Ad26]|nr:hypothetical protein PsAD26_04116 [Pseudovibrio sp. Ad26]
MSALTQLLSLNKAGTDHILCNTDINQICRRDSPHSDIAKKGNKAAQLSSKPIQPDPTETTRTSQPQLRRNSKNSNTSQTNAQNNANA